MKKLLSYFENQKTQIEKELQELTKERISSSKRVSEIQVMIIGLSGELNAMKIVIEKMKEE